MYKMNILRKDNMTIEDFCLKMKILDDKLIYAGSPITRKIRCKYKMDWDLII